VAVCEIYSQAATLQKNNKFHNLVKIVFGADL
jgi:hypothetical protein